VGLHYGHRDKLVNALRSKGRSVIYEIGPIFDEYRHLNCRAKIGLNWASLQDLNARAFELLAMERIAVMNNVPDMKFIGMEDGKHYLGFNTLEEAVDKVDWALSHEEEAKVIAKQGREFVLSGHTYDDRIQTILETVGLV
jgi:spore maturation protein CgeB